LFYAANTFHDHYAYHAHAAASAAGAAPFGESKGAAVEVPLVQAEPRSRPPVPRARRGLREEQLENESAAVKIIGVTLETRPDTIDEGGEELRR
jgi:histone acetyltransferase (RNA polymerase elongator complex component)